VLPALSVDQIRHLLKELRQEQQITLQGKGPASRWYPRNDPAPPPPT
jgi:hypothetical protein